MDIDLSALRMLESEKDISMDTSVKAIEDALLVAYHRTESVAQTARVQVDRKTGHVTVWAAEMAPDGTVAREYDDTPDGFGRIAATTARQVILQRLRDVEDEMTFGEYAGREGDIVAGVIQQGNDRGRCSWTWARSRPCCRPRSRCPVSSTCTASGSGATCCTSARAIAGRRSRCRAPTATW